MIKLTRCKNCGSSKFKVSTYTRLVMPYEKYTGEITKELLAEDDIKIRESPSIITRLFCAECGEDVQEDINLDELTTKELCTELQQRVEELEQFREKVNTEEFNKSIINNTPDYY